MSSTATLLHVMVNPYKPPSHTELTSKPEPTWFPGLFLWFYPGLLVSSLYGTWLAAWLVLGHMPRPSIDDPKGLGIAVGIPYLFFELLLVGFPAAALLGVSMQFFGTRHAYFKRVSLGVLLAASWAIAMAILLWDPLSVVDWYMD